MDNVCVFIYGNRQGECGIAVLVSEIHVRTGWVRSTGGHIGSGANAHTFRLPTIKAQS